MLTLKLSSSQSLAEEKAPAPPLYSLLLLLLQTLAISFQLYTAIQPGRATPQSTPAARRPALLPCKRAAVFRARSSCVG